MKKKVTYIFRLLNEMTIKSDTFSSFTSSFLINACATLIPPAGLFLFPWLERLFPTSSVSFLITVPKVHKKLY